MEGQTTQWPKEEGQTTQWPKEGQTTQWPKEEGQTIQWPKGKNNDLQNIAHKTKGNTNPNINRDERTPEW